MSLNFINCVLAPSNATSTKHEYISSSGDDLQSFGSKITANGLPPLFIPGKSGGFVDVIVAYIESTDKFFCQLQDQADNIIQMSDKLNAFYATREAQPLINPLPGTLCAAKYSADGCWYRGFVLDRPRPSLFEIYFLDYGNVEMVHMTDLKTLTADFSKFPPRAFTCKLHNVANNAEILSKFKQCSEGRKFVLKLENEIQHTFVVILFDVNVQTKAECNVNDFLNGLPTCIPSGLCTVAQHQPPMVNGNIGATGDQISARIESFKPTTVITEQPPKHVERPSSSGSSSISPTASSISPHSNRVESQPAKFAPPPVKNFSVQKPAIDDVIERFSPFQIPAENPTDVYIIHVTNPEEFYVHSASEFDELDLMTVKLQTYCSKAAKKLPAEKLRVGAACATKFSADGAFYRCEPAKIDGDKVTVHFVDYGNSETVAADELLQLSDEFIKRPCFTIRCCVDTLEPLSPNSGYDPAIKDDMNSLAGDDLGEPVGFRCQFLSREEPCLISLKRDNNGFDDLLAKMGHCRKVVKRDESFKPVTVVTEQPPKPVERPLSSASPSTASPTVSSISPQSNRVELQSPKFATPPVKNFIAQKPAAGDIIERFPPFQIPTEDTTNVYIIDVTNPEEFYIHLASEFDDLDLMTIKLQTYCLSAVEKLSAEKLRVGVACATKFSADGAFYRCELTKIEGNRVTVHFVDYGNSETVAADELLQLSDEFIKRPCFTTHCCVNTLEPLSPNSGYDPAIKDDMNLLAGDELGEPVGFRCQFLSREEPCFVSLKRDNDNFDDLLANMGHCRKVVKRNAEFSPIQQQQEQNTFYNLTFKSPAWPTSMPHCEVSISTDLSPDELYLQKYDTIEELASFAERLQTACRNKTPKFDQNLVKLGYPCAAIYVDDDHFYRGAPVEILSDGMVKVQFVDYGNCQTMAAKDLYELPQGEFWTTPHYVVRAKVMGVRPIDPSIGYTEAITEFIDSFALDTDDRAKKFRCSFKSSAEPFDVELTFNGANFVNDLIATGTKNDYFSSDEMGIRIPGPGGSKIV